MVRTFYNWCFTDSYSPAMFPRISDTVQTASETTTVAIFRQNLRNRSQKITRHFPPSPHNLSYIKSKRQEWFGHVRGIDTIQITIDGIRSG